MILRRFALLFCYWTKQINQSKQTRWFDQSREALSINTGRMLSKYCHFYTEKTPCTIRCAPIEKRHYNVLAARTIAIIPFYSSSILLSVYPIASFCAIETSIFLFFSLVSVARVICLPIRWFLLRSSCCEATIPDEWVIKNSRAIFP